MLSGMIARDHRDEMVRLMETVLEEIGPRESCGEAEGRLGEMLRRRWSELGFTVEDHAFRCHPRAALGFIPITVGLYLGAAACYWAAPVAAFRGWKLRRRLIPFGGTDAAAFTRAGISSVSLGCQDITRLVPNYHTRLDTLDRVRPESLVVMLHMALDMIAEIDAGALDGQSGDGI
jgi:hypothetical protein